jgi:hypothetical protein
VRKNDNSELKFRKFSLLEGRLQDELVMLDDAVISQAVLQGMLVNVTSQRMLNAMGYKRLHRFWATFILQITTFVPVIPISSLCYLPELLHSLLSPPSLFFPSLHLFSYAVQLGINLLRVLVPICHYIQIAGFLPFQETNA